MDEDLSIDLRIDDGWLVISLRANNRYNPVISESSVSIEALEQAIEAAKQARNSSAS